MIDGRWSQWLNLLVCGLLILLKTEGFNIGITYVETAVAKGAGVCSNFVYCIQQFGSFVKYLVFFAVCLDGSPPAYHLDKGFGAGINNWLVHIEVCPSPSTRKIEAKRIFLI